MMTTKEKIMRAAAEVFAEYGYTDTTNRMIAAQAGVNHALINYHFSGKRELYKRVVGYLIDKHTPSDFFTPQVSNDKEWRKAITAINKRFLLEIVLERFAPKMLASSNELKDVPNTCCFMFGPIHLLNGLFSIICA